MASSDTISHPAHLKHELTLRYTGFEFKCNCCRKNGTGERYRCRKCDFDLHKQCALDDEGTKIMALPLSISHTAHLEHKLALEATDHWKFVCSGCCESGTGERYRCHACKFDLHKQCALEEGTKIMAFPGSITHPSHRGHNLSLEATDCWKFVCKGCRKRGAGERYRCRACKFDLHKRCALGEGTKIMASSGLISHPAHLEHKLTLYASDSWNFMCNGCREGGAGESYRCHACDFDLHKQCFLNEGTKLVHPLLKNIELELRFQAPSRPKDGSGLVCDACCNAVLGFHYHSSKLCLHPCCTVLSTTPDEKKDKDQPSKSDLGKMFSIGARIGYTAVTGDPTPIIAMFTKLITEDGASVEETDT